MSLRKHGLKVLGLSVLAALGLMAFSAGGAQAAGLGGEFLVETSAGKFQTFAAAGIASEPITGDLEAGESGKLTIAGLGIILTCQHADVKEGKALVEGIIHGILLYLECTVLSSTSPFPELTKCTVQDEIDKKVGVIATNEILGLAFLHPAKTGETYVLVEPGPASGGVFAKIEILGGECAASGLYEVTGSTVLLVKSGDALNVLVVPVAEPTLKELFPTDVLKFGERKATLAGAANVRLAEGAKFADKSWGCF